MSNIKKKEEEKKKQEARKGGVRGKAGGVTRHTKQEDGGRQGDTGRLTGEQPGLCGSQKYWGEGRV